MSREKEQLVIGIDLGNNSTKICSVLHNDEPNSHPKILDNIKIETKGIFRTNIIDIDKVCETIFEGIKRLKNTKMNEKTNFIVSINSSKTFSIINNSVITKNSINNEIDSIDLDKLLKDSTLAVSTSTFKNCRIIQTIPIKYKIDNIDVYDYPIGMQGKRIEARFLYILCPNIYIERLENIFENLNIKISEFVPGSYAESEILLTEKQKRAGTVLINFGSSSTSLIVYENNSPVLYSVLDIGSDQITNDLALGLQLTLEEAESVKLGLGEVSFSKRKYQDIVEARLEYICTLINNELEKIKRKELLPGGIVLTGDGSKMLEIDVLFRKYMNLPVKFANKEIREFSNGQIIDSSFARVYGLTFFDQKLKKEYSVNNFFKNIKKNIHILFKKMIP